MIKKYFKKKFEKKNNIIWWIILFFVLFLTLIFILIIYLYYLKLVLPLPNVSDLKNIKVAESSIIYDRNWWELYKIYSENRTYVNYDYINKNMINAIVAWEDKRFWTTPGFDTIWIIRAIIKWLQKNNNFSGTSWITQQLAKITYLSNEKSIKRKLKELYLAIQMNNKFSKKDILEVYLNKVFFWGNSYWVEQASKTFFWINASELNILQSSILASLPKAPTSLSPYNKKEFLLWYLLISDKKDSLDTYKILDKKILNWNKNIIKNFTDLISNLNIKQNKYSFDICNISQKNINSNLFKVDKNNCINFSKDKLLWFLNSLYFENIKYKIEYKTGRKDYVLWRMLEDWYINISEYKKALIDSFGLEFNLYSDKIKYPHFVMYVKEYLVKKYSEDILKTWGLRIYTSIDPILQDKAEEILKKRVEINKKKYWASNAALISINNKTWEILSFIWWVDYFDKKNWGYNDMLTARLQPGSTFKPFVYMLAMIKNNFWAWTILTDNKVVFPGWYAPKNSDWLYMWRMTLSKALNYSRNIPAIKIYYAAWKENEIINFLDKFWIKSLKEFKKEYKQKYNINYTYSAPMVLWTVQITPLELAQAYSVFANNWIKNDINPILKIVDKKWKILETSTNNLWKNRIITKKEAYTMNSILSNSRDRPKSWNYFLTIPWRKMAAKTWTSTKQYLSDKWTKDSKWKWYHKKIIIPRNMWTVWYTPQITTVVWAWNTTWKELLPKAYWINWAWPIMRDFMKFAHKDLPVEDWVK